MIMKHIFERPQIDIAFLIRAAKIEHHAAIG